MTATLGTPKDRAGHDDLLGALARDRPGRLTYVCRLDARSGESAPWPDWAPADAVRAWQRRGVDRPWRHQVDAAEHARAGRHVVLATGTASGKSLAFCLAALAAIRDGATAPNGRGATALYLSPTKALAADQERSLRELDLPWLRPAAYDGDTSTEDRAWARRHANFVLTNPDLLHHSLLPGHRAWAGFLRALDVIVVDELHAYRGVFGAHVAAIVRRLRRICEHYGGDPVVVTASATTADPGLSASRLIGAEVAVVDVDAAASPPMTIAFWQPAAQPDGRTVPVHESADLLAGLVRQGAQAIAFVRSRRGVETLADRTRDLLANEPDLAAGVAGYRGGYLPEERRVLEASLRAGEIRALATTSALELGIDVHGIDAVLVVGWPGTRAALWQRFGRAGRGRGPALGLLVAENDPIDAYLTRHPDAVIGAPVEAQVFDPQNPYVLSAHLAAAAAELPLTEHDARRWFGPTTRPLLDGLVRDGLLRHRPAGWFWTRPDRASDLADLRGAGPTVRIVERGTGRILGTVDSARAPATVHPGAVYVHQGVEHVVDALDADDAIAWARVEPVDYSTTARSVSDLRIASTLRERAAGALGFGTVEVTSQVVSYVRRTGDGARSEHPLDLPQRSLTTQAVWWTVPESDLVEIDPAELAGAAHAAEHAAIGLLPLYATCDRWDLGGVSTVRHPDTEALTVFVHDGLPGGAGFAERGFDVAEQWLRATRETIASCACKDGCPACIHSPKCGNGNEPLAKAASVRLLDALLTRLVPPLAR